MTDKPDMPDEWELEQTARRFIGAGMADDMNDVISGEISVIKDMIRLKIAQVSALDYDEQLEFVAFEMAGGWCFQSLFNGERTSEKLDSAAYELNRVERERIEGLEIPDRQLAQAEARVENYQLRLEYWRRDWLASQLAYRQVVYWLQQDGRFGWMATSWTPPDRERKLSKSAKARRQAGANAKARINDRQRELWDHMSKEKLRQAEEQLAAA